jgi:hypothetical protein
MEFEVIRCRKFFKKKKRGERSFCIFQAAGTWKTKMRDIKLV